MTVFEAETLRAQFPDTLAETYEGIGDVLSATGEKTSEAREMYGKSLEIWQRLKEANKLDGENANKMEVISQKVAKLNS